MSDKNKKESEKQTKLVRLVEDKGLPPVKQTRPMPPVKEPKKATKKEE